MKKKIEEMCLQEVKVFQEQISMSSAPRTTKTALYEACDERMKQLDLSTATVVRSETDK